MKTTAKPISKIKLLLAGVGVITLVVAAGYLAKMAVTPAQHHGPSELSLHPERQDSILAGRRAQMLQKRLGLNSDQTKQVAQLIEKAKKESDGFISDPTLDPGAKLMAARSKMQDVMAQIEPLLTPEQKEKFGAQREASQRLFAQFMNNNQASQ
jgi:Spy/CpxP family protein refolding chaperone